MLCLPMKINKLVLHHYRNLTDITIPFKKDITVLVGENGQGKTNIVESLVFLSTGRSFRVRDDALLIQDDQRFAAIEAELDSKKNLRVVLSNQGKYMQVDRNVVKKLSDFVGQCNVVLFSPNDLSFFSDSRRRRRQDIDLELGKISKSYMKMLAEYHRILLERNALLKTQGFDPVYFELISNSLVDKMVPIIEQRHRFIMKIEPLVIKFYQELSHEGHAIKIAYRGPVEVGNDLHQTLGVKVKDSMNRDMMMKATQVGIHRDDYIFLMDNEPVVNRASQGQRRLLMLAFKFALMTLVYETRGFYPILCLDDLFSELDVHKRHRILKLLPVGVQVIITTTDRNFIETDSDVQFVYVNQGLVSYE